MGHTPFGYQIENGQAVVDDDAATKLRTLFQNYLLGKSLEMAALNAGIHIYHASAKRLLTTTHYIGDDFYPAIIDKTLFQQVQEEINKRASSRKKAKNTSKIKKIMIPTLFSMRDNADHYENPVLHAEHLYSLIKSEVH